MSGPRHRQMRFIQKTRITVIANASATGEASLIFCSIGAGSTAAAQTVWLDNGAD